MNIAITQNYVSSTNLPDVLRFLEQKPQQISGCRDRREAIKPDCLLKAFVSALREHHPPLLTQAQELAKQGWQCDAWNDDYLKGTRNGDGSSTCLESTGKRRKGKSVVEQAKLTLLTEDDSCAERKKDEGFMFSFI